MADTAAGHELREFAGPPSLLGRSGDVCRSPPNGIRPRRHNRVL